MDWFSEKFIEDCVAEAPNAFLGRSLRLCSQQPRLEGFIPDLIFVDDSNIRIIVEVQRSALDRYHLYKCLEYRDILWNKEGGSKPVVALVCEVLPERYKTIASTHNIETHIFSREAIIEKAVENCPLALKRHLLKSRGPEAASALSSHQKPLRRYLWNAHDSLVDVYGFALREFGRCDLWKKVNNESDYFSVIWDAKAVLEWSDISADLLDPREWRIDNLIAKPERWVPPAFETFTRIRKPKAVFDVFVTSKDNLSVRWYPEGVLEWSRDDSHDWVEAPSTEPYAYQRPENEILFIRDIYKLHPDAERYARFPDGEERAAINTILLALIWAMIKHIHVALSVSLNVRVNRHFLLEAGEIVSSDSMWSRHEIAGWRIVTDAQLKIEEADKRIKAFEAQTKINVDTVIETLKSEISGPKAPKGDRPTYLARALRERGHKITATPIRQLLEDLKATEHAEYIHLETQDK